MDQTISEYPKGSFIFINKSLKTSMRQDLNVSVYTVLEIISI